MSVPTICIAHGTLSSLGRSKLATGQSSEEEEEPSNQEQARAAARARGTDRSSGVKGHTVQLIYHDATSFPCAPPYLVERRRTFAIGTRAIPPAAAAAAAAAESSPPAPAAADVPPPPTPSPAADAAASSTPAPAPAAEAVAPPEADMAVIVVIAFHCEGQGRAGRWAVGVVSYNDHE